MSRLFANIKKRSLNGIKKLHWLGFPQFFWRWLIALSLVAVVYNPSGFSYGHWLLAVEGQVGLKVLAALPLLTLVWWCLHLTWHNLGVGGLVAAMVWLIALVSVVVAVGWLPLDGRDVPIWLSLVVIATVLAIGLTWAHIRKHKGIESR